MDIKKQMENIGMTQVDLIFELRKRGLNVQPPALSSIINGLYTFPKAIKILDLSKKIVAEKEKENEKK